MSETLDAMLSAMPESYQKTVGFPTYDLLAAASIPMEELAAQLQETAEKLEHWYRQDGCRSKNEFLERAVNYYADHLAAGTSTMLPRAIQSAIDGRLQLLEQRLSSLLFKQAVELDMGLSLLAECVNLDETVLRKQRAKSVNDVKRTNGQLRLEQKVRVQEPFDEWPD